MKGRTLGLMLCFLAAGCVGCGSGAPSVVGVVTLDGAPVSAGSESKTGTVLFQPVGDGPKARGVIDEDGQFELYTGSERGAAAGEYVVSVNVSEVIPSGDPNLPPYPKRISPARYSSPKTSGLRFTVEPGRNYIDLKLESS